MPLPRLALVACALVLLGAVSGCQDGADEVEALADQTACRSWTLDTAGLAVGDIVDDVRATATNAQNEFGNDPDTFPEEYFADTVDFDAVHAGLTKLARATSTAARTPGLSDASFEQFSGVVESAATLSTSVDETQDLARITDDANALENEVGELKEHCAAD